MGMTKLKRNSNKDPRPRKKNDGFSSCFTKERQKAHEKWMSETYSLEEIAWLNSDTDDIYIDRDEETKDVYIEIPTKLLSHLK